ncbi:unnamed protein product [marine sediment metagenome]|uniref:Uncharacterized protein n=1 Tax=marine sediment metagenome TaxID=412755 RepID=X0SYG9_9ZZZZ
MSKALKQEINNCYGCPFMESSFSKKLYNKKAEDVYIHICFHTKKKLYKDFHIPKWCVLPDYK